MINVEQRKALGATPAPEARHRSASASEMATHKFQMAQQAQQSYQCQATSRKRARNSASGAKRQASAAANQRATGDQSAPLKGNQPQQTADNSVWVISLMNNIEQLLATFNSINNQSKLQQQQQQQPYSYSASSSGYSTPSNSLSPPFLLSSTNCSPSSSDGQSPTHSSCSPYTTASSSPPASCISSCNPGKGGAPVVVAAAAVAATAAAANPALVPSNTIKQQHLPRSSLSRQIKFHEYKGPPQAKRSPPSSTTGNKPPVAGSSSSQQTPSAISDGSKRAENERRAPDPVAAIQTNQLHNKGQQQRPVASVDQIKFHQQQLARQQQQQQRPHDPARGCVQFAVNQQQRQQMSRLASKLINSNRAPAEQSQELPCDRQQTTCTAHGNGDCRAPTNNNNPPIHQQLTVRQQVECRGAPTVAHSPAGDQRRVAVGQLGGNNQFIPDNCGPMANNSSEQPMAHWNGFDRQQSGQGQLGSGGTLLEFDAGRLDAVDTDQFGALDDADLGAVDTCDIEPTICFNGQNFDESLMFSEFIDLQDVPMNVNESDWLRKFLPPCI